MDREFSEFISRVLDRTDIVTLISRYVKVEKRGNTHWACCPFHHETQPSFAVNEAKQFFHCFGCKESGNAISFVMKMENVEFIDALKMLAEQAGMEMPKFSGGRAQSVDKKRRERLYNLMRDAARHYHDNLSSPRAKIFNDYLQSRQLTDGMVRRFGLGASLDFQEMLDYLSSKGYNYDEMHAVGIAESKDGRQYDVFGKRLMYPIIDNLGNVVAFGGRTLEADVNFAKYRNSSQTEIFDKSKVIYAVNLLKKRKAKAPIDYVIMTEGYMDVIALHKAGFDTAVASMGTALTVKQARQLKLYSDIVYISYDGDTAGQKATLRGLDILRETGLIVKVVRLPDGLDPDDVIKRGGREAYQKLLDSAVPLTEYKIDVLKARYNLDDADQKAIFAMESAKVVTALDNPVEQEQYLRYVSKLTGFSLDALARQADLAASELAESVRIEKQREAARGGNNDGGVSSGPVEYDSALMFFLSSILQSQDYVDFDRDVSDAMPDGRTLKLYSICRNSRMKNMAAYVYGSDEFGDEDKPLLNELLDYKFIDGDGRDKFVDTENMLYCKALDVQIERANAQYKRTGDKSLLAQVGALTAERNKIKNR